MSTSVVPYVAQNILRPPHAPVPYCNGQVYSHSVRNSSVETHLMVTARCSQTKTKQTVKELVDNAIDACRGRTSEQDAPTVRVVLRRPCQTARDGSEPVDVGEGTR